MTQILKDKIVLLTGASRGIGAGIALELGKQGAILYGTATSEKGASSITQTFKSNDINGQGCLLYTSPSPRDKRQSRMPSSA